MPFFLSYSMDRILKSTLIAIAATSGLAWMVASGFMTVYFRAGMVADWGEEFTSMIEYSFAFGWLIPIAALSYLEALYWKNKRTV